MAIKIKNHGGGHSYIDDETGRKIPSVTSSKDGGMPKPGLMKWHAEMVAQAAVDERDAWKDLPPVEAYRWLCKAPYRSLNRAAAKGTTVHKYADRLLAGEEVDVPPALRGYVESAAAFIDDFDFRAVYTEAVVHDAYERDWAGKLDAYGSLLLPWLGEYEEYERDDDGRSWPIIDWKTAGSGVHGEVAYQMAPYRWAKYMIVDGEEIPMPRVDLAIAVHLEPTGYTAYPMVTGREQYRDFLHLKEVARISEEASRMRLDPLIPPRTSRLKMTEVTE